MTEGVEDRNDNVRTVCRFEELFVPTEQDCVAVCEAVVNLGACAGKVKITKHAEYDKGRTADLRERQLAQAPKANVAGAFKKYLCALIEARFGQNQLRNTVIKKADLSQKICDDMNAKGDDYRPSKDTAICLALALKLDFNEAEDFLSKAGFALMDYDPFDAKIAEFIRNREYDIDKINAELYANRLHLIGSSGRLRNAHK